MRACHVQGLACTMSAFLQSHSWTRCSNSCGSCRGRVRGPKRFQHACSLKECILLSSCKSRGPGRRLCNHDA